MREKKLFKCKGLIKFFPINFNYDLLLWTYRSPLLVNVRLLLDGFDFLPNDATAGI